jgi:predicted amidohydrolase
MRLAVVQSKPILDSIEKNLAAVQRLIGKSEFDLVLLPELFASGYFFHNIEQVHRLSEVIPKGPGAQFILELASRKGAYVCGGILEREHDRFFNTALLAGPDGEIGRYRKLHLFNEEKLWFTPGDSPPVVYDLDIGRIGIMICFDWRFPEVARLLAIQGAQLLLHPANLVQPHSQDAMVTRCLENGVFAATANRVGADTKPDGSRLIFTGKSQVVSPHGKLLKRASKNRTAVFVTDIELSDADFKTVTEYNHLLKDRKPEHYGAITRKSS